VAGSIGSVAPRLVILAFAAILGLGIGAEPLVADSGETPCGGPATGIVSCWTGDGTPGDSVGTNNGAWVGTPSYAAGRAGGDAFSLTGANYVDLGSPASLQLSGSLTVDAWVNPGTTSGSDLQAVLSKWAGDSTLDSYGLFIANQDLGCAPAGSALAVVGVNGTDECGIGGGAVPVGQWSNIGMTYSSPSGTLTVNTSTVEAQIGHQAQGNSRFFAGLIGDVSVYDRALSMTEMQQISGQSGPGGTGTTQTTPTNTTPTNTTPMSTTPAPLHVTIPRWVASIRVKHRLKASIVRSGTALLHCADNRVTGLTAHIAVAGQASVPVTGVWLLNGVTQYKRRYSSISQLEPAVGISTRDGLWDGLWSLRLKAAGRVIASGSVTLQSESCGANRITFTTWKVASGPTGKLRRSFAPGATAKICDPSKVTQLQAYFRASGPLHVRVVEHWKLNGRAVDRFVDPELASAGPFFGVRSVTGLLSGRWSLVVSEAGQAIGTSKLTIADNRCPSRGGGSSGGGGGKPPKLLSPLLSRSVAFVAAGLRGNELYHQYEYWVDASGEYVTGYGGENCSRLSRSSFGCTLYLNMNGDPNALAGFATYQCLYGATIQAGPGGATTATLTGFVHASTFASCPGEGPL
jgi:hypothetical protein